MSEEVELNMTTVKDLKGWLNRFPDDTVVEFAIQQKPHSYESYGDIEFESPKLNDNDFGDGWEFFDFRGNQFVESDSDHYNKCFLRIGERS